MSSKQYNTTKYNTAQYSTTHCSYYLHDLSLSTRLLPLVTFGLAKHETPLHSGGESSAAAASQARILDFLDNPRRAFFDNLPRLVPVASLQGPWETPIMLSVKVGEYSVLVLQASDCFGGGKVEEGPEMAAELVEGCGVFVVSQHIACRGWTGLDKQGRDP